MEAGRISTGMTEKKRTLLDIAPADRARLLASATAYAAGRRTYLTSSPRLKPGDSLHSPDSKGTSGLG